MSDEKPTPKNPEGETSDLDSTDYGKYGPPKVPVKDWIPEPVFDSSDYLDRPVPGYEDDPTEDR